METPTEKLFGHHLKDKNKSKKSIFLDFLSFQFDKKEHVWNIHTSVDV